MHAEATHKIYVTRDYSRFNNIIGNRKLNEHKIKKIMDDIKNGFDMLQYCPIVVDEQMNVIDGQHRLQVAKNLESNVWYVIANTTSLHQIAKMNTNTERWKGTDFINCYIENGVNDYVVLNEFMIKWKVPLTTALNMLMFGKPFTNGSNAVKIFENGEFIVKFLDDSNKLMKTIYRFKTHKNFLKRDFVIAISILLQNEKCSIEDLITKFNKNSSALDNCSSKKQFMNALEQIYNQGNSIRRVIF